MAPAGHAKDIPILISDDDEMEHDSPSYSPATHSNYHFDANQMTQQPMTATSLNHPTIDDPLNGAIKANGSVTATQSNDHCNANPPINATEEKYPFNADIFIPIPIKRNDNPMTHEDSAILDPFVARGLIDTSMLPVDRGLFDWIDDTCVVLDKVKQCSFEMQALLRRSQILHMQEVTGKDARIAGLCATIAEKNARITKLRDTLVDRNLELYQKEQWLFEEYTRNEKLEMESKDGVGIEEELRITKEKLKEAAEFAYNYDPEDDDYEPEEISSKQE
ncbi:uncharacterized protein LOC113360039 [Papaver somniferum]|nr:uncharacterized protein LOC113360039 [Papaver somniferum]